MKILVLDCPALHNELVDNTSKSDIVSPGYSENRNEDLYITLCYSKCIKSSGESSREKYIIFERFLSPPGRERKL